jgi:hypothetical protein
MIKDGIKAIRTLTDKGIATNCTLVFSAGQAILAAKAGATYVSPFIGRIDDSGVDGLQLLIRSYPFTGSMILKRRYWLLPSAIRCTLSVVQNWEPMW